jgi:amino acid transporter
VEEKKEKIHLIRELGLVEALAIGLGSMLSAGIFVLSASAVERVGPAAGISFILAGLVCLPTALILSELATGIPKAGGSFIFISRALGPLAGSIVGLGNWLGLTFFVAFNLNAFGYYLSYFIPINQLLAAIIIGILLTVLNFYGARITGLLQKYIVIFLIITLIFFIYLGFFKVEIDLYKPFTPYGWGVVIGIIGLIIVSFASFVTISTVSEEIKNPGRNIPLAIVGSLILVMVLYGLILSVITGVLPYNAIGNIKDPIGEVASKLIGKLGKSFLSVAAILATASSANAAIITSSRIDYALGRDKILPSWFSYIHPKYITPSNSILLTGILSIILSLTRKIEVLAEVTSTLFMISFIMLNLSLIIFRRANLNWYKPVFQAPFYPWLPLSGALLSLFVLTMIDNLSKIIGFSVILGGIILYYTYGRERTTVKGLIRKLFKEDKGFKRIKEVFTERMGLSERNEILVPVKNPKTAKSLISLAGYIARGNEKLTVTALNIVEVSQNISISVAQKYILKKPHYRKILNIVENFAKKKDISINTILQAAYGVTSGILSMVREINPRIIILGWRGPITFHRIYENPTKDVIEKSNCDVAVLMDKGLNKIKKILVPISKGPHCKLSLRLAEDISKTCDCKITAIHIKTPRDKEKKDEKLEKLNNWISRIFAEEVLKNISLSICNYNSVVKGILTEAKIGKNDLIIIGASEEWRLKKFLFGSIPDYVANKALCSVLMVKKHEVPHISWIRKIIKFL